MLECMFRTHASRPAFTGDRRRGQLTRKPESAAGATEPVAMMAEVIEAAAADSGRGAALLGRVQSVRVIESLAWRYPNPGALLAERLGMPVTDSVKVATGGNGPQMALNDTAAAIQRRRRRRGQWWLAPKPSTPDYWRASRTRRWSGRRSRATCRQPRTIGIDRQGTSNEEMARSLVMPTQVYPVFENALRAAAGRVDRRPPGASVRAVGPLL